MRLVQRLKCWWKHDWEHDGGKWILRDVSLTTRRRKRCGLKQDIKYYHLIPNYISGATGHGLCFLDKERRPGDVDYDMKFEMNERPK